MPHFFKFTMNNFSTLIAIEFCQPLVYLSFHYFYSLLRNNYVGKNPKKNIED